MAKECTETQLCTLARASGDQEERVFCFSNLHQNMVLPAKPRVLWALRYLLGTFLSYLGASWTKGGSDAGCVGAGWESAKPPFPRLPERMLNDRLRNLDLSVKELERQIWGAHLPHPPTIPAPVLLHGEPLLPLSPTSQHSRLSRSPWGEHQVRA